MGKKIDRRSFLGGVLASGAWFSGVLPSVAAEEPADWKRAFARLGFDPDARDSAMFIVIGDPHVPWSDRINGSAVGDMSKHLIGRIDEWNAMRPRPKAVLSVGDQVSTVSSSMGNRLWVKNPKNLERAAADIRLFKSYFDRLEVPLYQTVGNHDCYPGEASNGAFYAANYPGWEKYGRYDLGGATLINLCGGHDGSIDSAQRAWLHREAKSIRNDKALFLMAHYPDLGVGRVDGYDIGVVIREVFSERTGETWLLAGHNHEDAICRYRLPGGGSVCSVTHVREPFGYWIYGLRGGSVVARVLVPFDRQAGVNRQRIVPGTLPKDVKEMGLLPLPFEHEGENLLWRHLINSQGESEYRVSVPEIGDAGSYFYYVGKTIYRLPLKSAKGATRFGLYGQMVGHRKTGEPVGLSVSCDGEAWMPVSEPWKDWSHTCYSIAIPEVLRSYEWLYVRIEGFGFGSDSSLAGFALLKGGMS